MAPFPRMEEILIIIKAKLSDNIAEIQRKNGGFKNVEQTEIEIYSRYLQKRQMCTENEEFRGIYSFSLFQFRYNNT